MNPKMSGFRKWAEIHEPTKIDEDRRRSTKLAAERIKEASSRLRMSIKIGRYRNNRIVRFPERVSCNPVFRGERGRARPNGWRYGPSSKENGSDQVHQPVLIAAEYACR